MDKYEIPNSWEWATLEEIADMTSGGTPSRSKKDYWNGDINWLKSGELKDTYINDTEEKITEEGLKGSSAKLFSKNTLLMAMYGATVGRLGILNIDSSTNQAVCAIFNHHKLFVNEYIFFYLLSIRQKMLKDSFGGAQPNLSQGYIKAIELPFAPINEQKRIVTKIEKLFSNLDNSDKYLIHLKKQLKRYRQSVLKSAFEGELTKEWREKQSDIESADELLEKIKIERIEYIENEIREKFKDKTEKWIKDKIKKEIEKYLKSIIIFENNILPKSWMETYLQCLTFEHTQDIVDGPFGSNLKASEYQDGGIPIVRLQNIDRNIFIDKNIQFVSEIKAEQLKRHSYKQGDIVITKLGAPLGKACIVPDTIEDGIIVADVVRLRLFEKYFDKKYVSYFINSNYPISQLEVLVKGTTRPRVNLTHIRELRVYVCSLEEQKEIVKQIEKHFSIIDKLEATVQQSIKESKRLRQSILKQAFEGKLVEQDPNDESAEILLEKIAKAKEEYIKAQKKQARKK